MAFGVTEAHVTRRLKLAHLPADVLAALKANQITLGNAAAFTITDDAKLALEVLEQVRGGGYSDQRIKGLLKPEAVKGSDRRVIFVGHEAYVEAGGRVVLISLQRLTTMKMWNFWISCLSKRCAKQPSPMSQKAGNGLPSSKIAISAIGRSKN